MTFLTIFFAAGPIPKHNNVSWRGNSGMKDGISDPSHGRSLVGRFYDAGDAIKFNFPSSFAMTMLSWSVIEYSAKYEVAGELGHVKEIIKWGVDYLIKTFNSSADTIDRIAAQVGQGDTSGGTTPNDHYCWMRPEGIDYPRSVFECHSCSDFRPRGRDGCGSGFSIHRLQGQQGLLSEACPRRFHTLQVLKTAEGAAQRRRLRRSHLLQFD